MNILQHNMLYTYFRLFQKTKSNEQQFNVCSVLLLFYNHNFTMMTTISANDGGREKKNRSKNHSDLAFLFGVSSLCLTPLSFLFLPSHHPLHIHTHTLTHSFSPFTHLSLQSAICSKVQVGCAKKMEKNGMNGKQISTKSYCVERKSMHHRQLARTYSSATVDRYYLPTNRHSFSAQCFALFSFVLVLFLLCWCSHFCFCTLFRFGFLSASSFFFFLFYFRVHICGRQNAMSFAHTGHILHTATYLHIPFLFPCVQYYRVDASNFSITDVRAIFV